MLAPHTNLINVAARRHLNPLGCVRKGRSRTWLLDRKWFVSVAEFQPSSYGKGSFLNVGAHFLWTWNDYLSFDLGHRVEEFEPFINEEQFAGVADRLALRAVEELKAIDTKLKAPECVALVMPKSTGLELWPRFHRAVSHGLAGESAEAARLFESLASRVPVTGWESEFVERCVCFASLASNVSKFRAAVAEHIQAHRAALGLPSTNGSSWS